MPVPGFVGLVSVAARVLDAESLQVIGASSSGVHNRAGEGVEDVDEDGDSTVCLSPADAADASRHSKIVDVLLDQTNDRCCSPNSCLVFTDPSHSSPQQATECRSPLRASAVGTELSVGSYITGYRCANFRPPLQSRHCITLPKVRDIVGEHLSNASALSSTSSGGVSHNGKESNVGHYAISPTVEIPKNVVSPLLVAMTSDKFISSSVMRTFYAATGDTILSSDPSCPSAAGPSGISLTQFRNFGKSCAALRPAEVPFAVNYHASFRQGTLTAIFECTAKPFQFLNVSSFCVALTLLAQHAFTELCPADVGPSGTAVKSSHTTTAFIVDGLLGKLSRLCTEVLRPYLLVELPQWTDPEVDFFWLDRGAQKVLLEYGRITREIFDVFSVAPEEEIASAVRRSSSLSAAGTHRSSSVAHKNAKPAHALGTVASPFAAHPPARKRSVADDSSNDDTKERTPRTTTERKNPRGLVFDETSASRRQSSADGVSSGVPQRLRTPLERLIDMGFDFVPPSAEDYFTRGCDQLRVMSLSSVTRVVLSMGLPNVTASDVTKAAKAASMMFPNHPYRRGSANKQEKKGVPAVSGGGAGTQSFNAFTVFGTGVHPLSRFVPPTDIFILEKEFVDVLLRLSVVAFPELVPPSQLSFQRRRRSTFAGGGLLPGNLDNDTEDVAGRSDLGALASNTQSVILEGPGARQTSPTRTSVPNYAAMPRVIFHPALEKLFHTYVEGFFLQSAGGTIESRKTVVVSVEDVNRIPQRNATTTASNAESEEAASDFQLALPRVKSVTVTETDPEADSFFGSEAIANMHRIPGWSNENGILVSELGGKAVAEGNLMFDTNGMYALFSGRTAVRAYHVLSANLPHGKPTSTVEEACNLATTAEFLVPPLSKIFPQRYVATRLESYRAVKCQRDGANAYRVFPFTLVRFSVQFSNDSYYWTPRSAARGLPQHSTPSATRSAPKDVRHIVMRQSRPTALVPPGLMEGLTVMFQQYARFEEVVKDDVISLGKWDHLCRCLFLVVDETTHGALPCAQLQHETQETGCAPLPCGGCMNCCTNLVVSWKREQPALTLVEEDLETTECLVAADNNDAANAPTPRSKRFTVSPAAHIPIVTTAHIEVCFHTHAEFRVVQSSNSTLVGHRDRYEVLTLESCVAALIDVLVNYNVLCNREPLNAAANARLLNVTLWWRALHGCLALESARRKLLLPEGQVNIDRMSRLVESPFLSLSYRRQWSVTESGIPLIAARSELDAQHSLKVLCSEFARVARAVKSVFLFQHGVCVAELVDNPKHQFDVDAAGPVFRSRLLSVQVLSPSCDAAFGRLFAVELPYTAALERLFHGGYLPFAVTRDTVVERRHVRAGTIVSPMLDGDAAHPLHTTASRRFWLLRRRSSDQVVGCLSNLPGQCATANWVPIVGSYESCVASLFLAEKDDVLSSDALLAFKLYMDAARNVPTMEKGRERSLAWLAAERRLRRGLEEAGFEVDAVFP